jgi:Flp pilus assembly protein TadG
MRSFLALVRRFHDDERGVFAVLFGVLAIVLVAAAGAVVDYTSMEQTRTRAQIALDSAVLGLAPTIYDDPTEDDLMETALLLVQERLNDPNVTVDVTDATYDKPTGTLRITGTVTVPMAFMQLIGFPSLTANMMAEAKKSSINLEVAVSLDNSGSMASYIDELQEGLNGLIEIVVNDVQEPTYSKLAIVPWTSAVYAGSYAEALRGGVPAGKAITDIRWADARLDVSGATKANPVVVTTATNHGLITGDYVYFNNLSGMTQLNGNIYKVLYKTATTFALQTVAGANVNGTSYGTYSSSSSDKVRRCYVSTCEVIVNATGHGFSTGDRVRIVGTGSNTYNNKNFQITKLTNDRFQLNGTTSTSNTVPLTSGGDAYCTTYGCQYYYFLNNSGTYSTYTMTKCVTERATDTYSDAPPTTTLLGPNYTSNTSGACDSSFNQVFTPLTSDKDTLYAASAAMDDWNTTAGHLGTAWAWYLLSPDWGYLWPDAESIPSAYNAENTLKVAVLMTDGIYNEQYCNGVVDDVIDVCDAPDDSTSQARELCAQMKDDGIVIYTVGFNISSNSSPAVTMRGCATDTSKFFRPTTGQELIDDFQAIAQDITDLRLSQ